MHPKAEEYIFYQGKKFQVEFYFTENNKIPAKEYLEKTSLQVKLKLAALVKYISESGQIFDKGKFRLVDSKNKIYEFKPLNHRFFNFFFKEGKIVITNAYIKKTQKVDRKELNKSQKMKKDYMRRVKGGVYYG